MHAQPQVPSRPFNSKKKIKKSFILKQTVQRTYIILFYFSRGDMVFIKLEITLLAAENRLNCCCCPTECSPNLRKLYSLQSTLTNQSQEIPLPYNYSREGSQDRHL